MLRFLLGMGQDLRNPSFPLTSRPATVPPSQDVSLLEARLSSLELACAGLWELLKTKHGYSDADLTQVIHEIDARDGKVDGKITKTQANCPKCNHKMLTRNNRRCLWCGEDLVAGPI